MGIVEALRGRRTCLDTNVFIYGLEGFPGFASELTALFAAIDHGDVSTVTSRLVLAELLVKPFREGNKAYEDIFRRAIRDRPGLTVVPVTFDIPMQGARVRAATRLRFPDAIHLATAQLSECAAVGKGNKEAGFAIWGRARA